MQIPAWLTGAWQAIRKLPVARWIKPLWKGALQTEAKRECDSLKSQLLAAVAAEGPTAIDRVFAAAKTRLDAVILGQTWLPGHLEQTLAAMIDEWLGKASEAAKAALTAGGIPALDLALTAAEDRLMGKIDAL